MKACFHCGTKHDAARILDRTAGGVRVTCVCGVAGPWGENDSEAEAYWDALPRIPEPVDSAFMERMGEELIANAHQGDWRSWRPDSVTLLGEIHRHTRKLQRALADGDAALVSELSADLGNFAMKAFDEFGTVAGTPELPSQR